MTYSVSSGFTRPVPPRVRRGCWRIPCGKRRTLCGHRIAVRPSRSRTPCRRRRGRPLCRAVAAGVQTYRRTFLRTHGIFSTLFARGQRRCGLVAQSNAVSPTPSTTTLPCSRGRRPDLQTHIPAYTHGIVSTIFARGQRRCGLVAQSNDTIRYDTR